jgi:hypothetical protein
MAAALSGCATSQPRPESQSISGVLDVAKPVAPQDPEYQAKQFLGVRLRTGDSYPYILSYQADALWRAFDGKRVVVTGERYEPAGQALIGPHFRPSSWRLENPGDADTLVGVGPEETLRGTFKHHSWPAGSKLAGETDVAFSSRGESYQLMNAPEPLPFDRTVEVKARRVEYSRFVSRAAVSMLWVYEVTAD